MSKLFSEIYYHQLVQNLQERYRQSLQEIKELLEDETLFHPLPEFHTFLKDSLKDPDLILHSPIKHYWIVGVEELLLGLELMQEDGINQSQIQEYWQDSLSYSLYLELIQKNSDWIEVSRQILSELAKEAQTFFYLQIKCDIAAYSSHSYRPFEDGGDRKNFIFLGDKRLSYLLPSFKLVKQTRNIQVGERQLIFLTHDDEILNQASTNIENALRVLQETDPENFHCFSYFTKVIISHNDPKMVSYSLQTLPGYSHLNFYHRDFIDLIDDLVHENSHHYLNAILYDEELIQEDDEPIYYSPWRETYRPIRGLYHAVFTFFMGMKLFRGLSKASHHFSKQQREKIIFRFLEEYRMLQYCEITIEHAVSEGKITQAGQYLMQNIYQIHEEYKSDFEEQINFLKQTHFWEQYKDLEKKLSETLPIKSDF